MSARLSRKQRLIAACHEKAAARRAVGNPMLDPAEVYDQYARELRQRGSGPLPRWAKQLADRLGVE